VASLTGAKNLMTVGFVAMLQSPFGWNGMPWIGLYEFSEWHSQVSSSLLVLDLCEVFSTSFLFLL
jgi:hypothetical protein